MPVIVDAAAELPPSSNLRRFVDEGAALVVFSGGKAIRGPQGSGVLAGRRELIESVRLQTLDMDVDVEAWIEREGRRSRRTTALGRSMKVGKEQIAGLAVALREFVARDHEAEAAELGAWLGALQGSLGALAGHRAHRPALLPAPRASTSAAARRPACSRRDSPPASRRSSSRMRRSRAASS